MSNKKCSICGEKVGENVYFTLKGKIACEGCFENNFEYASKIIVFKPNESPETQTFCKDFGDLENIGEGYPTPIKSEKWINSDGWRGYTNWEIEKGYIKIADGWITSFLDSSTAHKKELADIFEELSDEKIYPPCPLYWIFGRTSNIFSTASCFVIAKENKPLVAKWLEEINGGVEGVQKCLN